MKNYCFGKRLVGKAMAVDLAKYFDVASVGET